MHESMHLWHYQQMEGSYFPSILTDGINLGTSFPWVGWGVHDCQENERVAFLEGFAEGATRRLILDLFTGYPDTNVPRTMSFLNSGSSNLECPLTDSDMIVRSDNGAMHAIDLLMDFNFYRRQFFSTVSEYSPGLSYASNWALPAGCEWYGDAKFDVYDVLRVFFPHPGTFRCGNGFADANANCKTPCPQGIDAPCPGTETCFSYLTNCDGDSVTGYTNRFMTVRNFYDRFQVTHGLPDGWIEDRERFLEPAIRVADGRNPWEFCN